MSHIDVAIYTTEKAHDTDPDMGEKVRKHLRHLFDNHSLGQLSIGVKGLHPDPPTENPKGNVSSPPESCEDPGFDPYSGSAELLQWWRDYIVCGGYDRANYSNCLVTNSSNLSGWGELGGSAPRYCVSAGHQIKNIDLYTSIPERSTDTKYAAMNTVLHEITHNFTAEHSDGYANRINPYSSDSGYEESVMLEGYADNDLDQCGYDMHDDSGDHYHAVDWSDCTKTVANNEVN